MVVEVVDAAIALAAVFGGFVDVRFAEPAYFWVEFVFESGALWVNTSLDALRVRDRLLGRWGLRGLV